MKDPHSLLFSIGRLNVWHRDKGGRDGGCIHFMRAHHGDQKVLQKITSDFQFNAKSGVPSWFGGSITVFTYITGDSLVQDLTGCSTK